MLATAVGVARRPSLHWPLATTLAGTVKDQQLKFENLTERVFRLETAPDIALAARGIKPAKEIDTKQDPAPGGRHSAVGTQPRPGPSGSGRGPVGL